MFLLSQTQELFDYGGGIPNELVVVLERCVGLSACWPGRLPDAYLTYRLYDLPPHSTPTVLCCADPVFADSTTYPLAVTVDLVEYLAVGSLWVYLFDDSESQAPHSYLAKTPVPLRALTNGRPIKGTRRADVMFQLNFDCCSKTASQGMYVYID